MTAKRDLSHLSLEEWLKAMTKRAKATEKSARWQRDNPEKVRANKKKFLERNPLKNREYSRAWRVANPEKRKEVARKWSARNPDYIKNRRVNDIQFKLSASLRANMHQVLKGKSKVGSAVKDLGCNLEELKLHLQSLFQEGMSWDNYGLYGWHIDHIIPLASFDLTDREQLLKACHYTNLQPRWAKDNLRKGAKLAA